MADCASETHDSCDPDVCITAKLRYWKNERKIPLQFTYGTDDFHGDCVQTRAKQQVAEAQAAGVTVEPAGARWV